MQQKRHWKAPLSGVLTIKLPGWAKFAYSQPENKEAGMICMSHLQGVHYCSLTPGMMHSRCIEQMPFCSVRCGQLQTETSKLFCNSDLFLNHSLVSPGVSCPSAKQHLRQLKNDFCQQALPRRTAGTFPHAWLCTLVYPVSYRPSFWKRQSCYTYGTSYSIHKRIKMILI